MDALAAAPRTSVAGPGDSWLATHPPPALHLEGDPAATEEPDEAAGHGRVEAGKGRMTAPATGIDFDGDGESSGSAVETQKEKKTSSMFGAGLSMASLWGSKKT